MEDSKKDIIRLVIQAIIGILTAIATALGLQSCMTQNNAHENNIIHHPSLFCDSTQQIALL